jgi:hypothetical protein
MNPAPSLFLLAIFLFILYTVYRSVKSRGACWNALTKPRSRGVGRYDPNNPSLCGEFNVLRAERIIQALRRSGYKEDIWARRGS